MDNERKSLVLIWHQKQKEVQFIKQIYLRLYFSSVEWYTFQAIQAIAKG